MSQLMPSQHVASHCAAHLANAKDLPVHARQLCGNVAMPAAFFERPCDLEEARICTGKGNKGKGRQGTCALRTVYMHTKLYKPAARLRQCL